MDYVKISHMQIIQDHKTSFKLLLLRTLISVNNLKYDIGVSIMNQLCFRCKQRLVKSLEYLDRFENLQ